MMSTSCYMILIFLLIRELQQEGLTWFVPINAKVVEHLLM